MKKIEGKISDYKIEELTHFSDILHYDGPILSHYKKEDDNHLFLWVDHDSDHIRWLVVNCEDKHLLEYLTGDEGMGELFSNKVGNAYVVDVNGEGVCDTVWEILDDSEIEEYMPEKNLKLLTGFPSEYGYLKK